MYYEPHCDYSQQSLEDLHVAPVDVIFTPVTTQEILAYPLVGLPTASFAAHASK